jgi:DNA-binding Lrp family transcriptional regulator
VDRDRDDHQRHAAQADRRSPVPCRAAQETVQVVECHRITGEDCFLLEVHAPSIGELEEILGQFLLFGQTTISIVVVTPVPTRQIDAMSLDVLRLLSVRPLPVWTRLSFATRKVCHD